MLGAIKRGVRDSFRFMTKQRCSPEQLLTELRDLGIRDRAVLLVHCSLSALGYVPGGAISVIESIREAIGPEGTLVFPTHSWLWMNRGMRKFDVRETPVCIGKIPDTFRNMPGATRSLHPTHSVAALGPLAGELTQGHEQALSPCGLGTPYHRLLEHDGQILFLGVGLTSNTSFHTIEALAGVDYLLNDDVDEFLIVDHEGLDHTLKIRLHRQGIPRRFDELVAPLESAGVLRRGRVGAAEALLISGKRFVAVMLDLVQEQPDIFLSSRYH